MRFKNRNHAGKLLANKIKEYHLDIQTTIIMAIPRGGIPIAFEVSKALNLPFSLIITKKLAPISSPEYGFGAIAPDGTILMNNENSLYQRLSKNEFDLIKKRALTNIKEKIKKYYIDDNLDLHNKNIIIVDDGIATGYTAMVAGKYVKNLGSNKIILAIPVAPISSIEKAKEIFDLVICYQPISAFSFAVGAYYEDFHQVQDDELYQYLHKALDQKLILGNVKATPSSA